MASYNFIVSFGDSLLFRQCDIPKVAAHLHCCDLLNRFHLGQLDWLRHGANPGTLIGLIDLGDQIIQIVEGRHPPAFVVNQAADDAAFIQVCIGGFQIFAAENHAGRLLFFNTYFSVVGLAVFESFLNSFSHKDLLLDTCHSSGAACLLLHF